MTGAVITIAIVLILAGGVTTGVVSHFRLQRHRADAVAMVHYRTLADEAVANQVSLQMQLAELSDRLKAIESMLRSVG